MTFQEQIEALPEAERTKFLRGLMAVAEAGRQAGVPPEELAKVHANTYNEVEKNMKDEDDDIQVYQRPWVGLTDENMETLILKHAPPLHPDYKDDSLHGLLQAANDFLRELNA